MIGCRYGETAGPTRWRQRSPQHSAVARASEPSVNRSSAVISTESSPSDHWRRPSLYMAMWPSVTAALSPVEASVAQAHDADRGRGRAHVGRTGQLEPSTLEGR